MNDLMPKNYKEAFLSIKSAIELSRIKTVKAANSIQLDLYWKIGLIIFNKKEEGKWGSSVVENLSQDLRLEYPEINGLSSSNLWRMLKFFNSYKENDKLAPLVREIGVATYKITKTLPESMKSLLPTPEKIAQKLSGLSEQP